MNITFRAHLLGSVADFCTDSGLPLATPEVVADLVVRLARYREEGTDLAPEVYLTEKIDDLVRMLPGGEKVPLAKTSRNGDGIERMLKISAPPAIGDWKVYGHETSDELDFGVFRGSPSPVSVDVDEIAMGEQQRLATVKVHRVANECVQIRSSEGTEHHIFLDAIKQDAPPPLRHLEDLVAAIVRSAPAHDREAVQIVSAFDSGHYEMGLNFVWLRTSSALKKELASVGVSLLGEMVGRVGLSDDDDVDDVLTISESIEWLAN